jgi:hypothetical protein
MSKKSNFKAFLAWLFLPFKQITITPVPCGDGGLRKKIKRRHGGFNPLTTFSFNE